LLWGCCTNTAGQRCLFVKDPADLRRHCRPGRTEPEHPRHDSAAFRSGSTEHPGAHHREGSGPHRPALLRRLVVRRGCRRGQRGAFHRHADRQISWDRGQAVGEEVLTWPVRCCRQRRCRVRDRAGKVGTSREAVRRAVVDADVPMRLSIGGVPRMVLALTANDRLGDHR
jgi:hypothetical protein